MVEGMNNSPLQDASWLQRQLTNPHISAWTEAHAGTGKTHVLVERFLRLLLAGEDARCILCLTYTRAAASEMKKRLLERLGEWFKMDDVNLKQSLLDMGEDVNQEKIDKARLLFFHCLDHYHDIQLTTIHSFCERVLGRFPLEAGIDPTFRVEGDDAFGESLLRQEAFSQFVLKAARKSSETTKAITELMRLSNESDYFSKSGTQGWKDALHQLNEKDMGASHNFNQLLGLDEGEPSDRMALKFITDTDDKRARELLGEELTLNNLEKYLKKYLTQKGEVIKKYKGDEDAQIAESFRAAWRRRQGAESLAHTSRQLLRAGRAYWDEFKRVKEAQGILLYDDLIHRVADLVRESGGISWVMYKLDCAIRHILIDEAQDNSQEQWEMIQNITQDFTSGMGADEEQDHNLKRTLFSVGDPKQSILGFGGASPKVFNDAYRLFKQRHEAVGRDLSKQQLQYSFRSSPVILEAVDKVFSEGEVRKGVLEGDEILSHQAIHDGMDGEVILWPLEEPAETTEKSSILSFLSLEPQSPVASAAYNSAHAIAAYAKSLIDGGELAGDIMVLVKQRGDLFHALMPAFKRAGVMVEEPDRFQSLDHIGVKDLIACGRFALNPDDKMILACLLKSSLCSLDDEDILELTKEGGSLWSALGRSQKSSHKEARATLGTILARADYHSLYDFFADCVNQMTFSSHDVDAVTHFLDGCLSYERHFTPSLERFLHLQEQQQNQAKRQAGEQRHKVKISTIHGAKGLEAETIILADATTTPNLNNKGGLLKGDDGTPPVWTGGATIAKKVPLFAERQKLAHQKEKENYHRLLYVAMTRAKKRLVITGIRRSKQSTKVTHWYDIIHAALKKNRDNFKHANYEENGEHYAVRLSSFSQDKNITLPQEEKHRGSSLAIIKQKPSQDIRNERGFYRLTPSSLHEESAWGGKGDDDGRAQKRGTLIHQLLQYLPTIAQPHRQSRTHHVLSRLQPSWDKEIYDEFFEEAQRVMSHPALASLFGEGAMGEVAIVGHWKGHRVSGRIDRMVHDHDNNQLIFADFKTGEYQSQLPPHWMAQMALYDAMLAPLWQDIPRRALIIQTHNLTIHELKKEELMKARQRLLDLPPSSG